MGNIGSNNESMTTEIEKIKNTLNEYLNAFFDKDGKWVPNYENEYLRDLLVMMDPNICKYTSIVLKDELSKLPNWQINIENNIINGLIVNKRKQAIIKSEGSNSIKKETICNQIGHHYTKIYNILVCIALTISRPDIKYSERKKLLFDERFKTLYNPKRNESSICDYEYLLKNFNETSGLLSYLRLHEEFGLTEDLNDRIKLKIPLDKAKDKRNKLEDFNSNIRRVSKMNLVGGSYLNNNNNNLSNNNDNLLNNNDNLLNNNDNLSNNDDNLSNNNDNLSNNNEKNYLNEDCKNENNSPFKLTKKKKLNLKKLFKKSKKKSNLLKLYQKEKSNLLNTLFKNKKSKKIKKSKKNLLNILKNWKNDSNDNVKRKNLFQIFKEKIDNDSDSNNNSDNNSLFKPTEYNYGNSIEEVYSNVLKIKCDDNNDKKCVINNINKFYEKQFNIVINYDDNYLLKCTKLLKDKSLNYRKKKLKLTQEIMDSKSFTEFRVSLQDMYKSYKEQCNRLLKVVLELVIQNIENGKINYSINFNLSKDRLKELELITIESIGKIFVETEENYKKTVSLLIKAYESYLLELNEKPNA